ncbi:hypothetical protein ABMA70_14030 [Halobacteriovorax sp. XZX-3]|uniref:hypothetical protein n=1 Tax=unclassified Halobacteriovorax TaxID=2639665 RepID=UPI000CD2C2D6|nr:hypothetical protein [Halobacteriovorax sp. DA5]POB13404.1 hypothetical protein C0Z22_09580 [Halobacteriovorax sp. DA5]
MKVHTLFTTLIIGASMVSLSATAESLCEHKYDSQEVSSHRNLENEVVHSSNSFKSKFKKSGETRILSKIEGRDPIR